MDDTNYTEKNPLLNNYGLSSKRKVTARKLLCSGILLVAIIVPLIVIIQFSTTSSSNISHQVQESNKNKLRATNDNETNYEQASTTAEPLDTSIQAEVEQGVLEGKRMLSRRGREYLEFRGIPYAKPPVADLRFKPPTEPEAWEGVRDATTSQPVCIQKRSSMKEPHGSEDCLYLNIFTPKAVADLGRRRNLLPVIFYVHGGGGGAEGDGSRYDGTYFMDEDIILVTVDYRLGVLGSLNLNISDASGNQGLKDQVMALKWVQSNIRAFGGNKNKVTLVGNSAGAHQVSTHLISPMSKSLFHGAIIQSGSTILPGYFSGDPVQDGIDLGIKLNCTSSTENSTLSRMNDLLNCFRNFSASDLVLSSIHLRHWFTFTYSVDSASEPTDQIFLPEAPLVLLEKGNMSKVPIMIGITSAEGLPQALQVLNEPKRAASYNQVPWTNNTVVINDLQLQLSASPDNAGVIAEDARDYYFSNGTKNVSIENVEGLTNMLSDRLFHHPIYITALKQFSVNNNSVNGNSNSGRGGRNNRRNRNGANNYGVYMYEFTHEIEVSRCQGDRFKVEVLSVENFGVCHADELQFFFPNGGKGGIYPEITLDHPYENFSSMVVHLWASFATSGVPSGASNNATWLPINGTKLLHAFELNEDPKMIEYFPERMAFWDKYNLTDLYR